MKRGLSLITSLMMTASVFGSAASQALTISPVSVVSAASEQPLISIGNSAFNGITKVSYGVKKVTVPVRVTASDLCSMVVDIQIKADKAGEADPVITDIREAKYPSVMANEEAGSTRRIVWTQEDLVAPKLDDAVMAYIDIAIPDDAKKDSTYTLSIVSETLDGSDKDESKEYTFDKKNSDLTEKIVFDENAQEDYTLKFAEKADNKWNTTKKIVVEPGSKVPVGLEIQSPASAIGAAVYEFDITNGAKISGFEGTDLGEYLSSESLTKMSWTYQDLEGYTFKDETHLFTVNVEIPADAKAGSSYVLSMIAQDTSTPEEIDIAPAELPAVELVVGEKVVTKSFIELEIDTVTVKRGTKTVELPVYVKNGDAAAIVAMFEASDGAKVVNVEGAGVVDGEVIDNEAGNKVTWTNAFTSEIENHKFTEDGEKLFILTVELPDNSSVSEYTVDFVPSDVDVSNAAEEVVSPKLKAGKIIIEDEEEVTTTEAPVTTTEAPATTTEAPATTTEAPATTTEAPATTTVSSVTTTVTSVTTTVSSVTTTVTSATTEAPVTTTVTEPPVTTTVTTTSVDIPVTTPAPYIPDVENIDSKIIPEDYKPEFYYEHEKAFYKLNDDFSATVEVVKSVLDPKAEKGYTEETVEVKLTKDNFVFPTDVTPKTVYNEKQFNYKVPVTLDVKALNVEADVKKAIEDAKITVNLPVFIGQLGDINLDHKVSQLDATYILREKMAEDLNKPSVINSAEVLGSNDAAKSELGDYMLEFARFLGDTNIDGKLTQVDGTYILRACLERDVKGYKDKNRIAEEIWKSFGINL